MPRGVRRRLARRVRKTRDAASRTRLQIVLNCAAGLGSLTVARMLRCAPATAVRVTQRSLGAGEFSQEDARQDNGRRRQEAPPR